MSVKNTKFILFRDLTEEDIDNCVGKTVVDTILKDPLMMRVGILTNIIEKDDVYGSKTLVIFWQPSPSMPFHRAYRMQYPRKTWFKAHNENMVIIM